MVVQGFNEEVIKMVMNKIYHYLVKIGANPEDAKDIVQDSFYKAILYIETIPPDKFSSWMFKVATNQFYDLRRKTKKISHIELEENLTANQKLIEDMLLAQEEKKKIYEVLQQMSDIYKHLLLLKYDLDLSYKEIASLLDMKEEKVKTYLARARQHFKKRFGRYYHE
ncbi:MULTISPECIES: RNA polymerase sigma factor [Paenibacillus]|uniref:RNA polymerase sigma factor SigM n=2 Tax=Paenibacillus TaxID=44249 RepID=A0A0U2VEK8_9BACL|nr:MULTISPECIES: sigma-70 family RNA polymerase sigma factor [Paenibacillus]ALS21955.1 RNA polymerase sigma factor SigM [Paenibacillus naphthalenovorans]NTZ16690.1 sigma-70 family RNA polymerase sigma factor [Paenibacillus sp. JMULE4]SDJ73536.1 RNA polymerase sigma-70 factor, ECF subfamily [Paenibacillus naphthalenovorans]